MLVKENGWIGLLDASILESLLENIRPLHRFNIIIYSFIASAHINNICFMVL